MTENVYRNRMKKIRKIVNRNTKVLIITTSLYLLFSVLDIGMSAAFLGYAVGNSMASAVVILKFYVIGGRKKYEFG